MTGPAGRSDVHDLRAAAADFRGALARIDAELAHRDVAEELAAERPGEPLPTLVDASCKALVEVVRKRCPGLLPAAQLEAGVVADPVPVPAQTAALLMTTAMREQVAVATTGRRPAPGADLPATVLWHDGTDALLVEVAKVQVSVTEGEVDVTIPVRCDQLPDGVGQVLVRLVMGTAARPTGLFTAASRRTCRTTCRRRAMVGGAHRARLAGAPRGREGRRCQRRS